MTDALTDELCAWAIFSPCAGYVGTSVAVKQPRLGLQHLVAVPTSFTPADEAAEDAGETPDEDVQSRISRATTVESDSVTRVDERQQSA